MCQQVSKSQSIKVLTAVAVSLLSMTNIQAATEEVALVPSKGTVADWKQLLSLRVALVPSKTIELGVACMWEITNIYLSICGRSEIWQNFHLKKCSSKTLYECLDYSHQEQLLIGFQLRVNTQLVSKSREKQCTSSIKGVNRDIFEYLSSYWIPFSL